MLIALIVTSCDSIMSDCRIGGNKLSKIVNIDEFGEQPDKCGSLDDTAYKISLTHSCLNQNQLDKYYLRVQIEEEYVYSGSFHTAINVCPADLNVKNLESTSINFRLVEKISGNVYMFSKKSVIDMTRGDGIEIELLSSPTRFKDNFSFKYSDQLIYR